jgi:hypothetical protein
MSMDHQRAVLISKLVNCSGRALKMHPGAEAGCCVAVPCRCHPPRQHRIT